ncbi:hypothetical protein ACFQH6_12140 [Halobacteriaceae archaeon GCM10025711]
MSRQFLRAKPLQAGKLVAVVVTLLYSTGVFFGLLPTRSVESLLLVPALGIVLVLVVAAETLFAGYRLLRADCPVTARLAERPAYSVVRIGEVLAVVLSIGGFVFVVSRIPNGPMAGPGAIGLLFVIVGLGVLILGGSLVRTLTEYYYHRRTAAA